MAEVYQGKYVRDNHLEGHCIHDTLKILYSDLLVAAFSSQIYYILLYYYYTKHLIHFIFQSKLFHVQPQIRKSWDSMENANKKESSDF